MEPIGTQLLAQISGVLSLRVKNKMSEPRLKNEVRSVIKEAVTTSHAL